MTQPRTVTVTVRCRRPSCGKRQRLRLAGAGRLELCCPGCANETVLDVDPILADSGNVQRCPVCGGVEFFIRRDFPQRLGLLLVIVFGLVASVFYYHENIVATFATLASLVVIDAGIYLAVGRVTVCYKCRAEFRGAAYNPEHAGFDLATSEKYG